MHSGRRITPFSCPGTRQATLGRWREQLHLTDQQTHQMSMILDDFDKYYDSVLAEGHERILQVLNPDQRRKFEKMVQELY